MPKGTKKKQDQQSEPAQVAVRMPPELLKRVKEFAKKLNEENPGLEAGTAAAVRVLVCRALDAEEKKT